MDGYKSSPNSPVIIRTLWDNVIKLKTPGMVYFHAILHKWHEKRTCVSEITLSDRSPQQDRKPHVDIVALTLPLQQSYYLSNLLVFAGGFRL